VVLERSPDFSYFIYIQTACGPFSLPYLRLNAICGAKKQQNRLKVVTLQPRLAPVMPL
jgi:hypothetical protein